MNKKSVLRFNAEIESVATIIYKMGKLEIDCEDAVSVLADNLRTWLSNYQVELFEEIKHSYNKHGLVGVSIDNIKKIFDIVKSNYGI